MATRWLGAALALLALVVALCAAQEVGPAPFYIQAEIVLFDSGSENICGGTLGDDAPTFTEEALGAEYFKGLYVGYTDGNFTQRIPRAPEDEYMGFLGPILHGRVGDIITVVLRNTLSFPIGLSPTGLLPAPGEEALFLAPVEPNATETRRFYVPESAGPTEWEPTRKLWLYRSMVAPLEHAALGLLGPVLISNATTAGPDAPPPPGRDIITVMQIVYEYQSPLYDMNMDGRTAATWNMTEIGLQETQTHHSINGLLYCMARHINMTQGEENVRWHMAAIGSELDLHSAHWHGNTFTLMGQRSDVIKMVPGSAYSLAFEPASPGTWIFHCHVNDHFNGGMIGLYTVLPNAVARRALLAELNGTVHDYYIQAEEAVWDYAPLGGDGCSGAVAPFNFFQLNYLGNYSDRIGSKYIKGLYKGYTDASYSVPLERQAEDAYLGFLGPIMVGEVGDTFRIHFRNALEYNVSMHTHGAWYDKESEGTFYDDGLPAADKAGDMVPPNGTYTYTWRLPSLSGPGPADQSTKAWLYHSHTYETADTYAGLLGSLIVGRRGALDDRLQARDVDREIVLFFSVMNEAASLFFEQNLKQLPPQDLDTLLNQSDAAASAEAGEATPAGSFAESNLKHSINGYMYCNNPPVALARQRRTRVHVISLGTEADVHSPNLLFSNFVSDDQTWGALVTMPGSMQSTDVIAHGQGLGLINCRTADHYTAGMVALYNVVPPNGDAGSGINPDDPDDPAEVADVYLPSPPGANNTTPAPPPKTYFLRAERVLWDYVPLGLNGCTGEAFEDPALTYTAHSNGSVGPIYYKALYRQYTDGTFSTLVPQPPARGSNGPLLFAEVGQRIEVVLRNALDFAINLSPDAGLVPLYDSANVETRSVAPGASFTYAWVVPPSAGPGTQDLSTVAYGYGSTVEPAIHPYAGLLGIMVIGRPGAFGDQLASTSPEVTPVDADLLLPLVFFVGDESQSPYLLLNQQRAAIDPVEAEQDPNFAETCKKSNVNGMLYCNLPDLDVPLNATVRVAFLAQGSEADIHAPYFEAQQLRSGGAKRAHVPTAELMPSVARTLELRAQTVGRWGVFCQSLDHYDQGMRAWIRVSQA